MWRAADLPRLSGRPARILTLVITIPLLAFFLWVLGSSLTWQNDIREKMGLPPADALGFATIVLLAIATFAVAFALLLATKEDAALVPIPLEHPFGSFSLASVRAGCRPSWQRQPSPLLRLWIGSGRFAMRWRMLPTS